MVSTGQVHRVSTQHAGSEKIGNYSYPDHYDNIIILIYETKTADMKYMIHKKLNALLWH
jgi:hypothetical protein